LNYYCWLCRTTKCSGSLSNSHLRAFVEYIRWLQGNKYGSPNTRRWKGSKILEGIVGQHYQRSPI